MDKTGSLAIRAMNADDLSFATECTASEGWVSEDRRSLEGFYLHHPKGCLIAQEKGEAVGICIATPYGRSGFIGELIVRPEARGRGVGAKLLQHGIRLLKDGGAETIYLDGVLKAVDLYERNGFHKVCRSWRFSGHLAGKENPNVRPMKVSDFDFVAKLDEASFGADRSFFLRWRLEIYPDLSLVQTDGERVIGYITGRSGEGWVSAGPWIAAAQAQNPLELLYAFAQRAGDVPISMGILDYNHEACNMLRSLGFVERADSPWRMALGRSSDLGSSPACYAVGSAAKG